jgi:hypothetical protein
MNNINAGRYVLTTVLLLFCVSESNAQSAKQQEKITLTPSKESKLELSTIAAYVNEDGSIRLKGKMELNTNKPEWYYNLVIDLKRETYTATPMTDSEKLRKFGRRNNEIASLVDNEWSDTKQAAQLVTYYTATLNLLSEDPIQIDLCKTTGNVSWYDNGSSVTATTGVPTFTAFNPTVGQTHWYLQNSYAYFLYSLGTPVSSNTAWAGATYYNWDFPPADQKTSVDHWIALDFFPKQANGTVGYYDFDYLAYGQTNFAIFTSFSWNLSY